MGTRIDYGYETWSGKFRRKFKENPWVPIGCLATTGALFMASMRMRAGKSTDMQFWLRARVALQGLTIVALVAGSMAIQAERKKATVENDPKMRILGTSDDLPRNEATTELLREKKREKERAEFEDRLKGAEIAHEEEKASMAALLSRNGRDGVSSTDEANEVQKAGPAISASLPSVNNGSGERSSRNSSWLSWFGGNSRSSSDASRDETSK